MLEDIDKLITESVLDWKRPTLAKDVWDVDNSKYYLKKEVNNKILTHLKEIPDRVVHKVWIIGSITSFHYNDRTDIDVHIIPNQLSDALYEDWKKYFGDIADAIGQHPLQFYLHKHGEEPYADAIYDVKKDKWLRWKAIEHTNLKDYYDKFIKVTTPIDLDKAELYRDLIDFKELEDALDKAEPSLKKAIEAEVEQTLDKINKDIDGLIETYEEIKDRRTQALHGKLDSMLNKDYDLAMDEITTKYRSAQLLPDNVIQKLLERYHYKEFLRALKSHQKEHGEVDSTKDVDDILKTFDATTD